jgi:hypothetical protein
MTMNASNDQAVPRHTTAILAIILVSYFMILLDNSIIFTALPIIRTAMHYSTTGLAWVQDAYTLVFGGLLAPPGAGTRSSERGCCRAPKVRSPRRNQRSGRSRFETSVALPDNCWSRAPREIRLHARPAVRQVVQSRS